MQYWQDRSVVNQQLLAKEAQTRQQIERLQEELKRLNKNIATQQRRAKGKGARSSHRQQADEMRRQKTGCARPNLEVAGRVETD
jgi:hypothetical protein